MQIAITAPYAVAMTESPFPVITYLDDDYEDGTQGNGSAYARCSATIETEMGNSNKYLRIMHNEESNKDMYYTISLSTSPARNFETSFDIRFVNCDGFIALKQSGKIADWPPVAWIIRYDGNNMLFNDRVIAKNISKNVWYRIIVATNKQDISSQVVIQDMDGNELGRGSSSYYNYVLNYTQLHIDTKEALGIIDIDNVKVVSTVPEKINIWGRDKINIKAFEGAEVQYTASLVDKWGYAFSNEAVTWSVIETVEGVSISEEGLLTIDSNVQSCKVKIQAASVTAPDIKQDFEVNIIKEVLPDEQLVEGIANQIMQELTGQMVDNQFIKNDLVLPTERYNASISWSSSKPEVITTDGEVIIPETDQLVTLTFVVTKGTVSVQREFTCTVPFTTDIPDEKAVALDLRNIVFEDVYNVIDDLILPISGRFLSSIRWESNYYGVISNEGKVNRPENDLLVTLTAYASRGSATASKIFQLLVKGIGIPASAEKIEIIGSNTLSFEGEKEKSQRYYAVVQSNDGILIPQESVRWELIDAPEGVTMNDGLLTVHYAVPSQTVKLRAVLVSNNLIVKEYTVEIINPSPALPMPERKRPSMGNIMVAAGKNYTVGLKADGKVLAVGANHYGQCNTTEENGFVDIVAIAASYQHTVGLKADGTVVAVGDNGMGQCNTTVENGFTDIVAIAAGYQHTVGLKSDGTVVAIGDNYYGQCNTTVDNGFRDIVKIVSNGNMTLGLRADGTVVAAGSQSEDITKDNRLNEIADIAAGASYVVALKRDRTVITVIGDNICTKENGFTDIVAIEAGSLHIAGLKSNGTVVATGDNYYGQCNTTPEKGFIDIVDIACGSYHTVGIKVDGTVVTVGSNYCGESNTGSEAKKCLWILLTLHQGTLLWH